MNKELELAEQNYKKDVLFWAGISGILIAIGYFAISILFAVSGFPLPTDGAAWIKYLDGKLVLWNFIIWLSVITNILYLVVSLGFIKYYEVKYKFWMILASIFFILFVILELAGTWSIYPTIIEIFNKYHETSAIDKQAMYLGSIDYASAHFQTLINSFYVIVLPSLAVIIISLVMWKEKNFGKTVPAVGIVSAVCNITSVFGALAYAPLAKLVMPGSFLILFWFLGFGMKFVKESKKLKQVN